ncbi:carboxypeptidase-like regulatory domain-containing protein [Mucilaginibacter kameinonensis]|uniref:carboxypeptidase-like regulatory domain-containing protein n=1 Tax=Mucilaginibacter kameinonensis TaxID=452286 RepID=UPI000EF7760F|nr:carboxypeptidase-like regulatory domain-containing protein [Mucilaginibacter kameinonensis]
MSRFIKAVLLPVVALLFSAPGFGQSIKGIVKDSTGKVVSYATVNLKNSTNNGIITYAISDVKGAYTLLLPVNVPVSSLVIEVRCIGYKNQSKSITDVQASVDFTLSPSINQLQAVVIKSSRPVLRTSGDTLSYKVSDFSSVQDRVIGDVIKKLPGITVAADGKISYNNKPISNLYIGGDNLLDDKYNIATGTIPQGVVDQVQVIQNHQPVKVLQNKVVSDDVALNLSIKKGAKLQMVGQESVGAGLPGNYDINLNAMMFKDKYKAINYIKGNNTGNDLQEDLVSHNFADYVNRIDNNVPPTVLSLGSVNDPALSRDRYLFDRSGLLNLNNLVNFKKSVQLKINAWYLHDTRRQDYSQHTTIYLPGDTVRYDETQRNRFQPDLLHTQFTLNINRDKYYLNNVLLLDNNRSTNYSSLNTNGNMVNQVFRDNALSFSNEFNLIKSMRSGNIIEAYSYISHSSEPENRAIEPNYNAATFNNNVPYARLLQNVNVPTWFTNNYISFKIPSNLITQSFRTGFNIQSQTLTSNLNVVQTNNTVNLESDSSINHLSWSRKKLYAEAAYDLPGEILKVNLTLPVSLQQINYSDTLYALQKSLTRLYFNPQLRVKYQTGLENYLTFLYSYRNETGAITDMYQGYILKDYRTLYANNAALTERQNQQAALGFNYRKALTLFFASLNAQYNHIASNNIASYMITNNLQQRMVLPSPNSTDSWAASGTVSKYSFALKTTFGAGVQWQSNRSVQIQNNSLLPFNTTSETVNISANTKVDEQVNFSYKAIFTQTDSHSAAVASAYHINQLLQQAFINYSPTTNLQFKLSGEHYFTRQRGNPDLKYFFADASARLRVEKWKTDLELSAVNFLNVKTYDALYLTANTLTASSYTLPGRIILLKVMFNL